MNNKKKMLNIAIIAIFAVITISKIVYLTGTDSVADPKGLFAGAVITEEYKDFDLVNGISYAYSQSLSRLFRVFGNRISLVPVYHLLLQTAALVCLFLGCFLLFGKEIGIIALILCGLNPFFFKGLNTCLPDNYFWFAFSIVFLLTGIWKHEVKRRGWFRSSRDEALLACLGILTGIVTVWHPEGFLLIVGLAFVLLGNHAHMQETWERWKKTKEMKDLLELKENEKDEDEEIMPVFSQIMILVLGILLGEFATLMKYTGVTGFYIKGQYEWWWSSMLSVKNWGKQGLSLAFILFLTGIVCLCFGIYQLKRMILRSGYGKAKSEETAAAVRPAEDTEIKAEAKAEEKAEAKEEAGTDRGEDHGNFLENPLPLPKKHVKKEMDFALNDNLDDFDYPISDKDDFDT